MNKIKALKFDFKAFRNLMWVLLPVLSFLFTYAQANAFTAIPVSVDSNGFVYFECPVSGNPTVNSSITYAGYAFATSTFISNSATLGSCSFVGNGAYSMDRGYANGGASTPDGVYWVTININSIDYYWQSIVQNGKWSCTGACGPEVSPNPNYAPTIPIKKNIEIIEPRYGTTTATTTFMVKIDFKTPFSIDFRPTTTRHYEIIDALTGELNYEYNVVIPPNTSENLQVIATTTVSTIGSKFIRAMYLDANNDPYSEIDQVFFNVATNTFYIATGLLSPRDSAIDLTQIDCGTFEFGCQVQKAITFLFYPSVDVLVKFQNLWQTIAEKKPFGYVTMTIKQLKQLDDTGSSYFTLGTVPFMDSLFTPFRNAVGTILWGLFAIFFYQKRLKHLDI